MTRRKLAKPTQPGHLTEYGLLHSNDGKARGREKALRKARSPFEKTTAAPLDWTMKENKDEDER